MTLGGVGAYFRTRLDGLGFREWTDGFRTDNIPSSILNKAYAISVGTVNVGKANQVAYEFSYPVTLDVMSKGFRDPNKAIDAALDNAQIILADLLQPTVRLQTDGLKDIRPRSLVTKPLQVSNDNAVMLTIVFDALLILSF